MATKTVFVCRDCGYESSRWMGKCPQCGEWNTMEEDVSQVKKSSSSTAPAAVGGAPEKLSEVSASQGLRSSTELAELDRTLGGGVVPGSVILIGGDPGIGKSTILMQAAQGLCRQGRVLYISGEESPGQIKMRADRMGIKGEDIYLLCETDVNAALARASALKPAFIIADSIQTLTDDSVSGSGGSVSQVRNACSLLTRVAKTENIPVFLVGHVTKEGSIAGPKVLEHMVDTVLYFEGERLSNYRILRCVKNRFGSTDEIGIFEMTGEGLREVTNPSALFTGGREHRGGSAVVPVLEGTRTILVEVQALVSKSYLPNPRRMAYGFDLNRLSMIIAVLEKKVNIPFTAKDVWVNVAGGVRISETAADLAVAAALVSSNLDTPLDPAAVALGEVGLGGELRQVSYADKRLAEAERLGFETCVMPRQRVASGHMTVRQAASLGEAVNRLLNTEK
ncbi:MAG: DNA repair protein RadA [Abditibacteriota bacterium]|nr:DNA repair protein RadA [Abditibacteriota bacterium]